MYLLNADEITSSQIPKDAFVVYQGHHGDTGAYYANVILPGVTYTEKTATYVNTEGRTQQTRIAVAPPAGTREDWKIIRALSQVAGATLPYDELPDLRVRMGQIAPSLIQYDTVTPGSKSISELGQTFLKKSAGIKDTKTPFELPIQDFYLTDPISRASRTMAKCSKAFTVGQDEPQQAVFQAT